MSQASRLFLSQFVRSPFAVGAVLPSSPALARAMVAPIDFATARVIVEFGPGTGAFTRVIAERLHPQCRYLGIELNETFCWALAADFPGLAFVHGSVGNLIDILASHDITTVDAIVCGLPWASLPLALQDAVFSAIDRSLAPGGLFITFAYLHGLALPGARALRRHLHRRFAAVSRSPVVWRNVPPAFAYVCRKGEEHCGAAWRGS